MNFEKHDERKIQMKEKLLTALICSTLLLCSPLTDYFSTSACLSACAHEMHQPEVKVDYHDLAMISISHEYIKCSEYDKALKTANILHTPLLKAKTIFSIGESYFDKGFNDKAFPLFDEAVKIVDSMGKPDILLRTLLKLADKYAVANDNEKALQILTRARVLTENIDDPQPKAEGLADIALKLCRIGERDLASSAAFSIDGFLIKYSTLIGICESRMKADEDAKAQELLTTIIEEIKKNENPRVRFRLYNLISDLYINTGDTAKTAEMLALALEEADLLSNPPFIAEARAEVASKFLAVNKPDNALDIAKNISNDPYQSRALVNTALYHAKSGQFEKAENITNSIKETSERIIALSAISTEYAHKGKGEEADKLFSRVLSELNTINDDIDKGYAFELVTKALIEAEQFERALLIANSIDVRSDKTPFLGDIASGYSAKGSGDKASEVAEGIEDIPVKIYLMNGIASDYIDSGNKKKILKVLSRVQELSDLIPEDLSRAEKYEDIAIRYYECGKEKKASKSLAKAEELVKAFKIQEDPHAADEDTFIKVKAFAYLASAYYLTDSKDQANTMFNEASNLAESIKDDHQQD
ncbi:hypothetical protein KKB18_02110 [bacterium]|nr:hypothetical protein [bacterium]